VARAVAVAGVSGELGAFGGRPGAAALDGGRVDDPDVVLPEVGVDSKYADSVLRGASRHKGACCSPTASPGRGRDEQVLRARIAGNEPRRCSRERLESGEAAQLGVGELGGDPDLGTLGDEARIGFQLVVDLDL